MSRKEFQVEAYMTASPVTIEASDTVAHAQSVMARLGVRHLPVLRAGELAGVLSERDVAAASSMRGAEPSKMQVSDVCSPEAMVTVPSAFLKDVAQQMAEKRLGSMVVMQQKNVVGILTTTDLARALAQVLAN